MSSIWKYVLINCLLVVLLFQAQAQDNPRDSTRGIQKPTGIRIGTDLIAIGKNIANSSLSSWEVNADVDFGRYYLALDYGSWSREQVINNGNYMNDGRYFRLGADINFMLKDPDKNMFFMGLRYARSDYSEQLSYEFTADDFGDFQSEATNAGVRAGWVEMTMGLRVKIWKQLWMGYTARMKILPGIKNDTGFDTYEIPGYGLTYKSIYWGFNYQVFWRFPLQNQK